MNVLGTICARGGSKGVKNKNIRELAGQPLISYTINYLKELGIADRIICSTDSQKIAEIAKKYGAEVPFIRPDELATDEAQKLPVVQHALEFAEEQEDQNYDVVVDLDPTAPLRKLNFLEEAFKKFQERDAKVLYSVCEAGKNPYFNMVELDEDGYAHLSKDSSNQIIRRQDAPKVYEMNASIYIFDRDFLSDAKTIHTDKTIIYEMPPIYSWDIDREIDFKFVEFILKEGVVNFEW